MCAKVFVPVRKKIQIDVDKFHKLGKINTSKSLNNLRITNGRTNIKCMPFKPMEKTDLFKEMSKKKKMKENLN